MSSSCRLLRRFLRRGLRQLRRLRRRELGSPTESCLRRLFLVWRRLLPAWWGLRRRRCLPCLRLRCMRFLGMECLLGLRKSWRVLLRRGLIRSGFWIGLSMMFLLLSERFVGHGGRSRVLLRLRRFWAGSRLMMSRLLMRRGMVGQLLRS